MAMRLPKLAWNQSPVSVVIVNLVNPKEKFFGVLMSLSAAGVTLHGINIDSFEDWLRQIAHCAVCRRPSTAIPSVGISKLVVIAADE